MSYPIFAAFPTCSAHSKVEENVKGSGFGESVQNFIGFLKAFRPNFFFGDDSLPSFLTIENVINKLKLGDWNLFKNHFKSLIYTFSYATVLHNTWVIKII